jgi:hypothetical protein
MDGSMRKLIRSSTDKMTLDIRQLEQAHKSTKAYVEQKTCTAMEALEELGNAVYKTLENMMEVLDEVPQELRDAVQEVVGGTAREDGDSVLEGIQGMQARWADLANLVQGLIPKSTQLGTVGRASHTPTLVQEPNRIPFEVAPQDSAGTAPAATTAAADPSSVTPNANENSDIDMDVGQVDEQAAGAVDDEPTPIQQDNAEVERSIHANSDPSGGIDALSDLTVEESPASPPIESPAKRKLDDDADDAPTEKKKKKAPPPKKKGGRRKGRGKTADVDPDIPQPDEVDAEGEDIDA